VEFQSVTHGSRFLTMLMILCFLHNGNNSEHQRSNQWRSHEQRRRSRICELDLTDAQDLIVNGLTEVAARVHDNLSA